MELSIERLRAAVRNLPEGKSSRTRVPFRYKIRILDYHDGVCGDARHIWTRDIGRSEIGLVSATVMPIRSEFIVTLTSREQVSPLLICKVQSCVKVSGGVFDVTAGFNEIVTTRKQAMKSALTPVSSSESDLPESVSMEIRRIRRAILS